jgi:hypothetical protein
MKPGEETAIRLALRRQLVFLTRTYHSLAWIFWLGVAAWASIVGLLVYESVTITAKLLR